MRLVCPGEETVAAYVAGKLPRDERDTFDSHLDTCSACQELVLALGKLASHAPAPATTHDPSPTLPTEPSDTELPGGQLGRYVLLAKLGAGGMGVVYSAFDPELDRRVALKVLRRMRGESLRLEARAIAKLAHPNVVAVHDVGRAGDQEFVAMEQIDGTPLDDWLRAPHTRDEILDVFVQAGRGLAAAHGVGLVHRDVKPSNVIVGKDGRARVVDFGLARITDETDGVAGTPAYMAPEQKSGDKVDARADQFAFCVSLWEALSGSRPALDETGTLAGVPERVTRALRRGLSAKQEARFPSMTELLAELAPPPRRGRRWIVATFVAAGALAFLLGTMLLREREAPACSRTGDPLDRVWNPTKREALRFAFSNVRLTYDDDAAASTIADLDAWSTRWKHNAEATCKATLVDKSQPAQLHALRKGCLDDLLDRLRGVVTEVTTTNRDVIDRADDLVDSLPSPDRCADVTSLAALPPLPPAERDRDEVLALRAEIAQHEAALVAGRAMTVRNQVLVASQRAVASPYLPLHARGELLRAQLELSEANYDEAVAAFHRAARAATAARDLELLAETWIELVKTLGNDPRTVDQAAVFDGYAEALVAQLADRQDLALQLEFARCNTNVRPDRAQAIADHCQRAIDQALAATPPKPNVASAARVRLGHYQRLLGDLDKSLATLTLAVDEAIRIHGKQHPDTAVALYSLGITELSRENFDAGIARLRDALAIRRAAFPEGNVQVAESLQGLGDALATAGKHAEAIPLFEEGLSTLDAARQPESAQAAQIHILLGMSLTELKRDEAALPHFIRAADIADRSMQHGESMAGMALRLAASVDGAHDRFDAGLAHLDRALHLLERGKASPVELGMTQQNIAELLAAQGKDPARARATAEAAHRNYVAAGAAGASYVTELDAIMKQRGWR